MTLKNKNKSKDKINVQCKVNYPTLRQMRAEGWGTHYFPTQAKGRLEWGTLPQKQNPIQQQNKGRR
jgi:hypothetical protein